MSITLRRDPVCSCPITDYRGLRLDANQLWLNFQKKTSVAAINITLGVPGCRADKKREAGGLVEFFLCPKSGRYMADSGADGSFLCL